MSAAHSAFTQNPSAPHSNFKLSTGIISTIIGVISFSAVVVGYILYRLCRRRPEMNQDPEEILPPSMGEERVLNLPVVPRQPRPIYLTVDRAMIGEALENVCSICLGDYEEQDVLCSLPECGHIFHGRCIERWAASNITCPQCRGHMTLEGEGEGV